MNDFKPIPGWSNYEIDQEGNVRSITRVDLGGRVWKGRLLNVRVTPKGYKRVDLAQDGRRGSFLVNVLLKMTWGPISGQMRPQETDSGHLNQTR